MNPSRRESWAAVIVLLVAALAVWVVLASGAEPGVGERAITLHGTIAEAVPAAGVPAFLVLDPAGGVPRAVIVIFEGRAYAVQTVPVGVPVPVVPPGPGPGPGPPPPDPVVPPGPGPLPVPPGPGPGPGPVVPDPLGFRAVVLPAVAAVSQPAEHKRMVAAALGKQYRSVAAKAAAGAYPSAAALWAENRAAVRTMLGLNLDAWKGVLDAIKGHLDGLFPPAEPHEPRDYVEALNALAAALDTAVPAQAAGAAGPRPAPPPALERVPVAEPEPPRPRRKAS